MKLKLKMPNVQDNNVDATTSRPQSTPKKISHRAPNATMRLLVIQSLILLDAVICFANCQTQDKSILSNEISHNETNLLMPNNLANQSHHQNHHHQQSSRDVTNLKLLADFRAIKLHWTYDQPNRPSAFQVRYCELTSWNAEIKCRQREMPVAESSEQSGDASHSSAAAATASAAVANAARSGAESNNKNLSVIQQSTHGHSGQSDNLVRVIGQFEYETNIHDLRALTNYTFQVKVSRFLDGAVAGLDLAANATAFAPTALAKHNTSRLASMARRLDVDRNEQLLTNDLIIAPPKRIETKPFGAEAARCLANSSEVLVFTGRHFGGRISVEGQVDARCQMLGNRSSEQSAYLFRIDHQICHSKTLDGDRIETMILVHENKDILTHNTARFLVLCNFSHKSFTVKASVSLPKIDSLAPNLANRSNQPQHRRPATITRIKTTDQGHAERVQIGSMPGIYRPASQSPVASSPRRLTAPADQQQQQQVASVAPNHDSHGATLNGTTHISQDPRFNAITSEQQVPTVSRQSKQLQQVPVNLRLPAPVDVSSRALQVERGIDNTLRESRSFQMPPHSSQMVDAVDHRRAPLGRPLQPAGGRQLMAMIKAANGNLLGPPVVESAPERRQSHDIEPTAATDPAKNPELLHKMIATITNDKRSQQLNTPEPIVTLTNNHRVAGGFMPLSQIGATAPTSANLQSPNRSQSASVSSNVVDSKNATLQPTLAESSRDAARAVQEQANFTIKYSPAEVNEYALDRLDSNSSAESLDEQQRNSGADQHQHRSMDKPRASVAGRQRSGRMRILQGATDDAAQKFIMQHNFESRMGDTRLNPGGQKQHYSSGDLTVAESQRQSTREQQPPTTTMTTPPKSEVVNDNDEPGPNDQQAGRRQDNTGQPEDEDSHHDGHQLQPTVGQSLVQNITGALLRLSLKTLGNLARKSLESLTIEPNEDGAEDSFKQLIGGQQLQPFNQTPRPPAMLITTTQSQAAENLQRSTLNNVVSPPPESTRPMSTTSGSPLTTTTTMRTSAPNPRSSDTRELDGFLMQQSTQTKTPANGAQPALQKPIKIHPPAEVSSSSSSLKARSSAQPTNQLTTTPQAPQATDRHLGHSSSSQGLNSSALNATATKPDKTRLAPPLGDWAAYGIVMLIALGSVSLVIIYLNFGQSSRNYRGSGGGGGHQGGRHSGAFSSNLGQLFGTLSPDPCLANGCQPSKRNISTLGAILPAGGANHFHPANHPASLDDGTLTISRQSLLSPRGCRHEPPSHSIGSAAPSPAPTSASRDSSQRENFCKNNELVYQDHVIFNSLVGHSNESFA